jgi:probable rRNA maturation factor
MPSSPIQFHFEQIPFRLKHRIEVRKWLHKISKQHGMINGSLNYIFCSDAFLLSINQKFLKHDTLTDIITFDYCSDVAEGHVSGEIYISIDRVRENARNFKETTANEIHRVMAHGLLHLCGFQDKTPKDQQTMRKQEENALALRNRKLRT